MNLAGRENLGRQKSALRRDRQAMDALLAMGLHGATIDQLHLGLKQPYAPRGEEIEICKALSYPLISERGEALGRYAYLNLPGVTTNPQHPRSWGPGPSLEYRLGSGSSHAVVSADIVDLWLAWQSYSTTATDAVFISLTAWGEWPAEWQTPVHWSGYDEVIVLSGQGSEALLSQIAPLMAREILRAACPPPFSTFGEMVCAGQVPIWSGLREACTPTILRTQSGEDEHRYMELGMFQAEPIDVSGGYCEGHLYYPVSVELRAVEGSGGSVVHRYRTMVVRSDGAMLAADLLPAPRGTASGMRVLALSDGTRIRGLPAASSSGTWSFEGIDRFVTWRKRAGPKPFRELSVLLRDVDAYLRTKVWIDNPTIYAGVATFIAMTFVHQVFDALPILLALGPAGTGKSEAGEAVSRLSFNSVLAGQLRAASMIRLLDQTHGLLVLDDMDGVGAASLEGDGEIAMALKQGYKRSTSRKPVADRGGRVRMVDFFGPKMVTRTKCPGAVLGLRMLAVPTQALPEGSFLPSTRYDEAALDRLRDELHAWGMANACEIRSRYESKRMGIDKRDDEIACPLRTLASFADDDFEKCLERYLAGAARTHLSTTND